MRRAGAHDGLSAQPLGMLQMALIWLRLAEYAAKTAARKECTELISPATVDGERTQHIG